jgi:polyisoprenoid-binding protein YceI
VAEPAYSTIQFSVPISNGMTRVTGKFNEFTIDIDLVDNDITKSRIKAVIKVSSLSTGNIARDNNLMTSIFFDVKKFPNITFVSDQITNNGNEYVVSGQFQMHGITRPMELPFRITGKKGEDVIGFSARYSILRSAYNLGMEFKHATDENFIDNEIGIEIDFWTKMLRVSR